MSAVEGVAPVESFARAAMAVWTELLGVLGAKLAPELLASARNAVASVLTPSVTGPHEASAASEFGQQMAADVASLTEEQRTAALAELGAAAVDFAYAVWAYDAGARARAAFTQLRGEPVLPDAAVPVPGEVPAVQDRFLQEVAKLVALDPVTAELVRLRGAGAHACRLCQSRRNLSATRAAGGVEVFEAVSDFESSDLSPRHKVALRMADAFIWQPMAWPDGLAGQVRAHFSPVESGEIVFDLMRNSSNKIAVAFAADAAHVDEGVEFYDIDPATGDLTAGSYR